MNKGMILYNWCLYFFPGFHSIYKNLQQLANSSKHSEALSELKDLVYQTMQAQVSEAKMSELKMNLLKKLSMAKTQVVMEADHRMKLATCYRNHLSTRL